MRLFIGISRALSFMFLNTSHVCQLSYCLVLLDGFSPHILAFHSLHCDSDWLEHFVVMNYCPTDEFVRYS